MVECQETIMDQWHRKYLGSGVQVYASLRNLREVRYQLDRQVTPDRGFIVLLDIERDDMSAYFPPGNDLVVQALEAVRCPPPGVASERVREFSREDFPIKPVFLELNLF